jgi:hypothetical protein
MCQIIVQNSSQFASHGRCDISIRARLSIVTREAAQRMERLQTEGDELPFSALALTAQYAARQQPERHAAIGGNPATAFGASRERRQMSEQPQCSQFKSQHE